MKPFFISLTIATAFLLISPTSASAQSPCDPAPSGLVSWWAGEGNALDQISGNNGTLIGNASYGLGEVGQGFVLNGSGEGVSVASGANLWLQNLTIETWLKRTSASTVSYGSGGNGTIFGYGPGGYYFGMDSSGTLFFCQLGNVALVTGPAITDTNFHHVAVSKNGSSIVFYLDGGVYPGPAYNPTFTFTGAAGIGYRPDNGDNSFYGVVDELSIYSRALSPSEVQGIFTAGSGGKCFTPVDPVITSQPTNQTVYVGQPANFSVTASGTTPLSYQWSFNTTNIAGATNATLFLPSALFANAGIYAVLVSNVVNSILSSNAVLTVNPLPPCDPPPSGLVSWWQAEGNANDVVSGNNGFPVGPIGYANGEVGRAFSLDGNGHGVQINSSTGLQLQDFTIETWIKRASTSTVSYGSGGNATIFGYGPGGYFFGMDSAGTLFFSQLGNGAITGQMITDTNFHHVAVSKNGSSLVFYLDGVAYGPQTYSVTFTFTGGPGIGYRPDNGDNSFFGLIDELSVYNRVLSQSEIQSIYLVGSGGKCYTPTPPIMTSQPTNQTVYVSQPANFSVTASGTPPLSFQWSLNNTNIAGATNTTLFLPSAQSTNAGVYSVAVSNVVSSTLSSNAILTVNPLPSCDPSPAGIVSWWAAEGNAFDQINGYDGTLVGGVSYGSGEVGQGFELNGNGGSGVQINSSTGLQLQDFTIETWIKRASTSTVSYGSGGNATIFGYGPGGYFFGMDSAGTLFFSQLGNGAITGQMITDTNFHHVAVSKNGSSLVFYLDGVAYGPQTYSVTFTFTGGPGIGYRPDNGDNSFFGLIDELSVYNRVLSQSEIQSIYLVGSGGKCPAPCVPHTATGTAILTNGFVVAVNLTGEGCGYTNAPIIHFVGVGGSGAQAISVVSNGVVLAINMIDAGSGYTSAPLVVIDPPFIFNPVAGIAAISVVTFSNVMVGTNYQLQQFQSPIWINQGGGFTASNPVYTPTVAGWAGTGDYRLAQSPTPIQAVAIPSVVNGFVVHATVINGGSGYVTTPAVAIIADVGSNAMAVASISGGKVTAINITSAGIGYVNPVMIQIDPPPATAISPAVVTTGVRLDSSNLASFYNYQYQFRPDLGSGWSNLTVTLFNAPAVTNSLYYFLTNDSGFFRLQYVP